MVYPSTAALLSCAAPNSCLAIILVVIVISIGIHLNTCYAYLIQRIILICSIVIFVINKEYLKVSTQCCNVSNLKYKIDMKIGIARRPIIKRLGAPVFIKNSHKGLHNYVISHRGLHIYVISHRGLHYYVIKTIPYNYMTRFLIPSSENALSSSLMYNQFKLTFQILLRCF